MISFYPGPSKMHPNLGDFLNNASESGILSQNHRSKAFENLYQNTSENLKKWLQVPPHFELLFFSSATECWQVLSQTNFGNNRLHIFNGAFGKKWADVSHQLNNCVHQLQSFNFETLPEIANENNADFIALTHCETSNGTYLNNSFLSSLRKEFPTSTIAIDATSCMAGVPINWENGNIWFASVQKCFGLPSGLAVMLIDHKTIDKITNLNSTNLYYNSLQSSLQNQQKWQTTHTPNILGIHLLNQLAQTQAPNYSEIELSMQNWHEYFTQSTIFKPLIKNLIVQSLTVITVEAEEKTIQKLKIACENNGVLIGNGYGNYSKNTFRIANFPAHTTEEKTLLKNILTNFE